MKTGLIVLGIIFLVIGGILYLMPTPTAGATATTVGTNGQGTTTAVGSVTIPAQLTIASIIIGITLFILGLLLGWDEPERVRDRTYIERREYVHGEDDDHPRRVRTRRGA